MGFNKNGIVNEKCFSTTIMCQYDTNYYVEPDGSVWIRIFHHNNPTSSRFSSTDSFNTSVYKDSDRWFNVSLCNLISDKWELMYIEKLTSTSNEIKHRWIQQTNPMGGTYADVSPTSSKITRITTSGYSTSTIGGGIYKFNGNSYLVIANSNNGNWYGAIGAWTAHNGGIPAYPNTVVTNGYVDLYLRVDNIKNTKLSKNKVGIIANDFYEI